MLIRQKGMPNPISACIISILSPFLPREWSEVDDEDPKLEESLFWRSWPSGVSHVANVWSKQSHQNSDNTHLFGYFLVPNISPISPLTPLGFLNFIQIESSQACPKVYWHFCSHFGQSILVSAHVCLCLKLQGTPCKYNKHPHFPHFPSRKTLLQVPLSGVMPIYDSRYCFF